MAEDKVSPAVKVAKQQAVKDGERDTVHDTPYGRVKVCPVSAILVQEVTQQIKDPEPPMIFIADKDREEPNYSDPKYLRAMQMANEARAVAGYDATIMFGLDLIDGLPEDDSWLKKLQYMVKRKMLDLSGYDLEDEYDLEFLLKRFLIADANLLEEIAAVSGITEQEVREIEEKSFRGKEKQ